MESWSHGAGAIAKKMVWQIVGEPEANDIFLVLAGRGQVRAFVDGRPVRSCLVFAVSLEGADITTVEGCCDEDGGMGPVQQAFQDCHGLQCGFCTPGFLMTIAAGLEKRDNAAELTEEEVDEVEEVGGR